MLDPERRILTRVQYWSDTGQRRELDKASSCSVEEEGSRSELKKSIEAGVLQLFSLPISLHLALRRREVLFRLHREMMNSLPGIRYLWFPLIGELGYIDVYQQECRARQRSTWG